MPESVRRARALARKLGAKVVALKEITPASDVIWLCHTDDALAATAKLLARKSGWKGKIVLHSSGALTSDVLAASETRRRSCGLTASHDDFRSWHVAKPVGRSLRG